MRIGRIQRGGVLAEPCLFHPRIVKRHSSDGHLAPLSTRRGARVFLLAIFADQRYSSCLQHILQPLDQVDMLTLLIRLDRALADAQERAEDDTIVFLIDLFLF